MKNNSLACNTSPASCSFPMSYESLNAELTRMIEAKEQAKDVYKNHQFCQPLFIPEAYPERDRFEALVDALFDASRGDAKKPEQYRRHVKLVLLNLAQCVVTRNWLLLSGDPPDYKEGQPLSIIGLNSFKHADRFRKFLMAEGLVSFKQGQLRKTQNMQNRYWPSKTLAVTLAPYGLVAEARYKPPYVRINEPDEIYSDFKFTTNNLDVTQLTEINEFAMAHRWACKAPIVQVFKGNPFTCGRLHTPFQNLPSREFNIRKQTLIDGEEIVETDFNANHLRLFLASNRERCVDDDPYLELAEISKTTRDDVKGFINVALNSTNYQQAIRASEHEWSVNKQAGQAIYRAFKMRYPKLNLLCGFGLHAMAHEGMILRKVSLQGIKDDVLALPIHDAIATSVKHEDWARETMLLCWEDWVRKFSPTASTRVSTCC